MEETSRRRKVRLRPYIHSKDYDYIHSWVTDERTHALWCANLVPYPMTAEKLQEVLEKDDECDVVGARNAGIFPVWYVGAKEATYAEKEDVLMVKKWADLQDIIITL